MKTINRISLVLIVLCGNMCHADDSGITANAMDIFENPATLTEPERKILAQLASVTVGKLPTDKNLDFIHCISFLNSRCEAAQLPANCRVRIDADPQALVSVPYSMTLSQIIEADEVKRLRLSWYGVTNNASFSEQVAKLSLFQWLSLVAGSYGAFYNIGCGGRIYLYPDTDTGGGVPAPKNAGWCLSTAGAKASGSIASNVFGLGTPREDRYNGRDFTVRQTTNERSGEEVGR